MAEVYQNPQQALYQLPASAQSVIPGELGQDFLSSLDQSMQAQEGQSIRDLMENQQSRGMLQSGDTDRKLLEQVLGPAQAQRQNALTGLAMQGAQIGQDQKYQTGMENTQFGQSQQLTQQNFQNSLQYLQQQASLQQQLVQLENQLYQQDRPSFGQMFGQSMAQGLGAGAGMGLMSMFGF